MAAAEPVSRHVSLIRGSIGEGFVAIYVIVGHRVALVDTGFADHPRSAIQPALSALGLSLQDIDLVLTTHGHADHMGGHAAVVSASAARVRIHAGDSGRLHARSVMSDDEFARVFRRLGLDERAAERERMLVEVTGGTVAVGRPLRDGDRIDLGAGVALEVVETPGHTAGSVTFLVHPDGTALAGDAIQGLGGGSGLPLYEDPDAYRASLVRLAGLDVAQVGMGHAFRSAHVDGSSIVAGARLGPLLDESARFVDIAAQTAAAVVAMRRPSMTDAVEQFLRRLPPPYATPGAGLETLGGASLHAAWLHLERALDDAGGAYRAEGAPVPR
ncbi:MAG: MBL fold metallo-hydrolase [Chloroflexi bacterium]|nr:MBL fold metallo-hydrolase [Chloroflexota bacterium]